MRPPSFLRSASSIASSSIFSTSEPHANPQPTIISEQSERSEHSVATDGTYRPSTNDDNEERILSNRIRLLTNGALSRHPSANMSLNFVGSHDFTPPTPAVRTPRRSRASSFAGSIDNRLSVIEEDRPSQPSHSHASSSANPHHRPFSRRFGLGEPPRYQQGRSPPNYTFWDIQGPKGEKLADLRNNAQVAKRGGWKRICIIGWLIVILILALAVGLGVGLSKKHSNSSSSSPAASPSPSPSPATGPFPAGSYTFTTYLSTVSTNCTSNAASWTCLPSVTYDSDPLGSQAQFNWIISTTNTTPTANPNFTISSSKNPFAIQFANTGLTLMDEGSDDERYSFKTTVPRIVYPTASVSIKCYYNDTQFSGNLYTKKTKTVSDAATGTSSGSSSGPSSGGSSPYGEWKYAVDATQSIEGGVDVPDCYHYENGQDGSKITQGYEEEPQGSFCSCVYTNTNPQ